MPQIRIQSLHNIIIRTYKNGLDNMVSDITGQILSFDTLGYLNELIMNKDNEFIDYSYSSEEEIDEMDLKGDFEGYLDSI